ncbi:MAG TPA: efflux RND transporter periplasmic adaptor subunit [Rhizomicrobium sp.]|nr:efflux RND transporter periplasmic adaptor subunit [Rhizomicrobium sp.]
MARTLFKSSRHEDELPADGMDRAIARRPAWRRYGPYVLAAVVFAGIVAWLLAGTGAHVYRVPIDRLTIATVTEGPFEDFVAARGTVAPYITNYLTTDQGGTVKEVLVEDGAIVKRGQPLIILSNPALQLQVASQQLAFEQTRFKYEHDILDIDHQISKLKADLARDKILLDGKAIAPVTYKEEEEEYNYYVHLRSATVESENVEQKIRASQITGGQSSGALNGAALANAAVEALTIRAPMDGQLTALDAEVGQSKAQGAVLGQVDSRDRFKLMAEVDEFYLGRVVPGQETLFTIDGHDYRARVAKIYPQVANGTFKVDFYFAGTPPSGIHTGQAVDMKLELGGAARAVMLPNGPFYQDTGGNWVFVLSPDGRDATRRTVRLGRRNPQYVEVLDGLKPGERVIVSGYEAFSKMDRVEFESAGSGGN